MEPSNRAADKFSVIESLRTRSVRLVSSSFLLIRAHVSWKIVAPYIVLTLILAAAGTYLTTQFVTGSLQDRFDNQLAEAARVASDSVVRREREHLSILRAMSFTVGVPEATVSADEAGLRRLIEPIAANSRLEFADLYGPDGKPLLALRLTDPSRLTYERAQVTASGTETLLIQDLLSGRRDSQGDKFAALLNRKEGAVFYTGGPVKDEGGQVVGAVLVGTSMTTLLPNLKREALADVTFYATDGQPLASTFAVADGEAELIPKTRSHVDLNGMREVRSLFGREFDLLYAELRIRNETVGMFSVALPSAFISSAGTSARLGMAVVFALATVAVIVVGLLIARGVTRPLLRLVATAHAVTDGDLTARSGVRGPDEVGDLAHSFDVMTERLAGQHLATIRALTSAIDARDPYTAGHSVRVGQLSVEIGRKLELPARDLQFLEIGGYLHDIGKIGIRDSVLLKPGSLTPEEREMIEDHPRIGLNIVQHVELAAQVRELVIGHHEKLDGSGYPYGLEGEEISIFARVGAVADMYDALTTARPYKPALTIEQTMELLKRDVRKGYLDECVVLALIEALPIWGRRISTESSLKGFLLPELREIEDSLGRVAVS
jgi:putative nucleotidyltransferase with HDIG domain